MADEISNADFLEIALSAINYGLTVTPLKGKAAFLFDWNNKASSDEAVIRRWAEQYPGSNCGAVRTDQYWILDVDSLDWFIENCPSEPARTLIVRTGSGKFHYYFRFDEASRKLSMRPVMNPSWKSKEETPTEEQKLLEYPEQCVFAGSVHPVTGRRYEIFQDLPIAPCPKSWVEWLASLQCVAHSDRQIRVNPLRRGWDPDVELKKAGLLYDRLERDGRVYYNYHHKMHMCLIRGASHAAHGEAENRRQSAFVYNPITREFWAQCFSGGCQIPKKTETALGRLGLRLTDMVERSWVELFDDPKDFDNVPPSVGL